MVESLRAAEGFETRGLSRLLVARPVLGFVFGAGSGLPTTAAPFSDRGSSLGSSSLPLTRMSVTASPAGTPTAMPAINSVWEDFDFDDASPSWAESERRRRMVERDPPGFLA